MSRGEWAQRGLSRGPLWGIPKYPNKETESIPTLVVQYYGTTGVE